MDSFFITLMGSLQSRNREYDKAELLSRYVRNIRPLRGIRVQRGAKLAIANSFFFIGWKYFLR